MVLLCCNCQISSNDIDWTTIVSTLVVLIIGIGTILFSYLQFKKTLNSQKEQEERQYIHRKLDEFYGPLLQLRMKSKLIYEKFSEKFRANDPNFATLSYLLDGNTFTGNDLILLKEIIEIGGLSEKLIHDKAGLIDDTNLRTNIIPRATTHFLIIRLAFQQVLVGETEKFRNLTFPKELDGLLETKKQELEQRLEELNKFV